MKFLAPLIIVYVKKNQYFTYSVHGTNDIKYKNIFKFVFIPKDQRKSDYFQKSKL